MTFPYLENRPEVITDTECAPNYWAIGIRGYESGRVVVYERTPDQELDRQAIARIARKRTLITFNGIHYDLSMLLLAMTGATNEQLLEMNNDIIELGMRHWEVRDKYGLKIPSFLDHIDLKEVSPAAASKLSLKLYGGRLHSRTIMDLPFEAGKPMSPAKMRETREEYLPNDLDLTTDLRRELDEQLKIRREMSRRYGMDLRSKSDAQIAEAVIKSTVEKKTGRTLYKQDIKPYTFKYEAPEFIHFETAPLQALFERICATPFIVRRDGYVQLPVYLKDEPVVIDGTPFQMGIGGLHSQESSVFYEESDDELLLDRDVRGYYPNQIIKSGRGPKIMGQHFQPVYQAIVREREEAKAAGDKARAEGGKVMSNGTFGKTGSPMSVLYAPEMLIQTTLGGQLSIMMLIERVGLAGFKVLSANTDGFITRVSRERRSLFESIIFDWECETGLVTEETRYRSIYMRDVNNYVGFYYDDKSGELKTKLKGMFAESGPGQPAALGLKKAPDAQICSDAAVAFLLDGTPVEDTIRECSDVRKFVVVYRVAGGCELDGEYIGKAVRWYYSTLRRGQALHDMKEGKTVASSHGAMPLMTLPEEYELPEDIDIEWYVREAWARVQDTGVYVKDPALVGRTGTIIGRMPDQKTYHIVDASTGVALCGREAKTIRDQWVEIKKPPHGMKLCTKCQKGFDL